MNAIEFTVLGTPAPKGSRRGMAKADGKGASLPGGSRANESDLLDWSRAVRVASTEAVRAAIGPLSEPMRIYFPAVPLRMKAIFRMKRPMGHFNKKTGQLKPTAPHWHIGPPDSSKLLRATEDDLQGIVILNDSHFSEHFIRKIYGTPGTEGAWIRIEQLG